VDNWIRFKPQIRVKAVPEITFGMTLAGTNKSSEHVSVVVV
jgi:hypothetical protein